MLKSSFKFAWRSLMKNRTYSILNIGGLAVAITSFYMLMLYATDELSYDKFHTNSERIFRIISRLKNGDLEAAMSGQPWGPNLVLDHSEFEAYTRTSFYNNNIPVEHGEEILFEDRLIFADSTFFDVFDFQLLQGSIKTVLDQPSDVVLTSSMAIKYFNEPFPVGKSIRINFNGEFTTFMVSGDCSRSTSEFSPAIQYDLFKTGRLPAVSAKSSKQLASA